jgi:transcriptional regulator with XRE-family HTH domain
MAADAPRLLIEARKRAGLSQAELARRASIPRSVLNAYERGKREPGADALAHVARAAGFELRLSAPADPIDHVRASRILAQVLDLAEALPSRRRPLRFPPFRARTEATA